MRRAREKEARVGGMTSKERMAKVERSLVVQQNLNSRQMTQISKGLEKLIAREQNELIRLLRGLKSEIRAENGGSAVVIRRRSSRGGRGWWW